MNKKERELLKYIEDNSEYSGDFNAINNRIVIDDSMLYKKKKRFPFLITISASLAGVVLAVVLVLPSLLSGNNNVANPSIENMESILQSEVVESTVIVESAPEYAESENDAMSSENAKPEEDIQQSATESENETTQVPEMPSFDTVIFNTSIFTNTWVNADESKIGENIGMTADGQYEIYDYEDNDESETYLVICIDGEYYLIKQDS